MIMLTGDDVVHSLLCYHLQHMDVSEKCVCYVMMKRMAHLVPHVHRVSVSSLAIYPVVECSEDPLIKRLSDAESRGT